MTVAGETRPPRPFLVLATQNPIELEGTYPLPEAQLDRFMFKATVNPPTADVLEEILRRTTTGQVIDVPQVADAGAISGIIAAIPQTPMASHLLRYVSLLVEATHPDGNTAPPMVKRYVRWGSSPRGAQAIVLASKAAAVIDGRPHVTADDVRWAAPAALRHRLVLGFEATAEGIGTDVIIEELLATTPEPKAEIREPLTLLSPALLARLETLQIGNRHRLVGRFGGEHVAAIRQHRRLRRLPGVPPGDDFRRIDYHVWPVSIRC